MRLVWLVLIASVLGLLVLAFGLDGAFSRSEHSGQRALASWYGPGLYGNSQACGGTLDRGTVGVAHKSLPCGSFVTICYRRCARLRVIDRGPFIAGRSFDLTAPARDRIGMRGGVVSVRWWRS